MRGAAGKATSAADAAVVREAVRDFEQGAEEGADPEAGMDHGDDGGGGREVARLSEEEEAALVEDMAALTTGRSDAPSRALAREFERTVQRGGASRLVGQWRPWWMRSEVEHVRWVFRPRAVDGNAGEGGENDEGEGAGPAVWAHEAHETAVASVLDPPPSDPAGAEVASLLPRYAGVSQGPAPHALRANLVELLLSLCLVSRLFHGDVLGAGAVEAAAEALASLSAVLAEDARFGSAAAALFSFRERVGRCRSVRTRLPPATADVAAAIRTAALDAAMVLDSLLYTCEALHTAHRILAGAADEARAAGADSSVPAPARRAARRAARQRQQQAHKARFFLIWCEPATAGIRRGPIRSRLRQAGRGSAHDRVHDSEATDAGPRSLYALAPESTAQLARELRSAVESQTLESAGPGGTRSPQRPSVSEVGT